MVNQAALHRLTGKPVRWTSSLPTPTIPAANRGRPRAQALTALKAAGLKPGRLKLK
jgi:hypothetical protein